MQAFFKDGKCYFLYDNVNDFIYLANTNGSFWYGSKYRSDTTPLNNGACSIGAGSIVRGSSSDTLTLTNMTFYKSWFTGFDWIRMYSQDRGGNDDPQPWDPPKGWINAW